jgi:hypothetical protein
MKYFENEFIRFNFDQVKLIAYDFKKNEHLKTGLKQHDLNEP